MTGMGVFVTEPEAGFDDVVASHRQDMWVRATRLAGPQARDDVVQEALSTAWTPGLAPTAPCS